MVFNIYVAPYEIIQPSTNDQIVYSAAITLTLSCSLSINIPANVTITWLHNGDVVHSITTLEDQSINTIHLYKRIPQPGVYQCVFNDTAGYILRRNITVIGTYVCIQFCNIFMCEYGNIRMYIMNTVRTCYSATKWLFSIN